MIFLSTLSLRRATFVNSRLHSLLVYFYPRSPCGERRITTTTISIASRFLSTLSLRRATKQTEAHTMKKAISIHALLAESDHVINTRTKRIDNFYPRSPCGERQRLGLLGWLRTLISIHALLAESDRITTTIISIALRFLSTLSLRRAT